MASNRKPTFARTLSEMDPNVSGSTDLAGEPKEKIPHQRASDKKPLLERYDIGSLIGQYVGELIREGDILLGERLAKCAWEQRKARDFNSLSNSLKRKLVTSP